MDPRAMLPLIVAIAFAFVFFVSATLWFSIGMVVALMVKDLIIVKVGVMSRTEADIPPLVLLTVFLTAFMWPYMLIQMMFFK